MVKTLSTGSGWIWLDTVDPGVSETNISQGNLWLNTASGNMFLCKTPTIGAQVWDRYPITPVSVANGGTAGVDIASARDNLGLGSGTPSNGQMLIGNGTDFTTASMTSGAGITQSAGAGSLTLSANTGGSVASVNLKTTGATSVFTTPAGVIFIPQSVSVFITASDTFATPASISVGTNGAAYDNILGITALTGLSAVSAVLTTHITLLSVIVPAATAVFVNVTTGAGATTLTGTVKINGFYLT